MREDVIILRYSDKSYSPDDMNKLAEYISKKLKKLTIALPNDIQIDTIKINKTED